MTEFEKKVLSRLKEVEEKEEVIKKPKSNKEKLIDELQEEFLANVSQMSCKLSKVLVQYCIPNEFSYEPYTDVFRSSFGDFISVEDIREFAETVKNEFPSNNLDYEIVFMENNNPDDYTSKGAVILCFILDLEGIEESKKSQ